MKKKMNGAVKFFIALGVITAIAAAVCAVLYKIKGKVCFDFKKKKEEPEECNGECENCGLCDVDDDSESEDEALACDEAEETEEDKAEETAEDNGENDEEAAEAELSDDAQ